MKYWSLFVGALILAVALPLCCGYYVVDGPKADAKLGDACPKGNECSATEECINQLCTCKQGNSAGDDLQCKAGDAKIGSTCFKSLGCEKVKGLKCSSSEGKGTCACDDGYHQNADGKTCAQDSKLGDTCPNGNECTGMTECATGVCTCKKGSSAGDDLVCKTGDAQIGSTCNKNLGCEQVTGLKCSVTDGKGTCACDVGYHQNGKEKTCAQDSKLGDACPNGNECTGMTECAKGFCTCKNGSSASDDLVCKTGDAQIGSTCNKNLGCEQVTGLKCSSSDGKGTCACDVGYHQNGEEKTCAQVIGSTCNDNATCEDLLANTECNGGQCQCKSGYLERSGICKPGAGGKCSDDDKCVDKYSTCVNKTCQCNPNYTAMEGVCRPGLNEKCNATDNPCSDLFADCGKNSTCVCQDKYVEKDNKCLAPYNMTCSPDDGCITKNADCMSNTPSKEWMCLCPNEGKYIVDVDLCSVIGSTCNDTAPCKSNTECNSGKCQCKSGYLEKSGICKPGAGGKCSDDDKCVDKYSTCVNKTCQCNPNYTAKEGVCRPGLHEKCDATDNPCSDLFTNCGINSTCECQDKYVEKANKCLAPYNMTCTHDDECITTNAKCMNSTQTMDLLCLCPNKEKYLKDDDKCSGSIATLTLWAAILSISLRFIM